MDLVDKEDHVRAVLQLVHHGLHAFLELASVLGARDQAGNVKRHDALAEEHAAHLALDDAQCQTFRDGRFAHAGLADQHGVVLLAAAEDLAHALDLLLPAHDGVQLAVLGHFGEVAAEVVQHRRLALAVAGLLSPGAIARTSAVVIIVVGALGALGLGAWALGSGGGAVAGEDRVHLVLHVLIVHIELVQGACGQVVLVLQHAQQHMFRVDLRAFEELGLEEGDLQHLLGLLHQGDLVLFRWADSAGRLHPGLYHFTQVLQVHVHVAEDLHGVAVAFADKAEQDVLNADMVVAEA